MKLSKAVQIAFGFTAMSGMFVVLSGSAWAATTRTDTLTQSTIPGNQSAQTDALKTADNAVIESQKQVIKPTIVAPDETNEPVGEQAEVQPAPANKSDDKASAIITTLESSAPEAKPDTNTPTPSADESQPMIEHLPAPATPHQT